MIKWRGLEAMRSTVRKIAREAPQRVKAALYQEAQEIMTESKRRCPVAMDGGTLRASGMVSKPVQEGDNFTVTMSYGGAASEYAIAVHEHLSDHSPPSWITAMENGHPISWTTPGTGPKYLEGPINEAQHDMLRRLAVRLNFDEK